MRQLSTNRFWKSVVLLVLGVLLLGVGVQARQVRIATYGNHERLDLVAARFMEDYPEIEVVVETYTYNEYPEKIVTMVVGGAAPDIVQVWAQYKPRWVEAGLLTDITEFWEERRDIAGELLPFVLDAARIGDRYYGIPHDYNTEAWIVQNNLFDEAGIPVPHDEWTVADFKDYAIKLNDPNGRRLGALNPAGYGWMSSWQWTRNWTGEGWLSDDRQTVFVDSPEQIEMVTFFLELNKSYEVMNGGALWPPTDVWGGGYAMWQGWVDHSFQLARTGAYDFRLATMPKAAHGQNSFGQGHMWSMPMNAKNPDDALVFLDWLLTDKGQEAMVAIANRQPLSPDPDLWEIYFSELPGDTRRHIQHFLMGTLFGRNLVDTMSYWTTWPVINTVMETHLSSVFDQGESPSTAMHRAAQQIRGLLADSN